MYSLPIRQMGMLGITCQCTGSIDRYKHSELKGKGCLSAQILPTDKIGASTVIFSGVIVGTEVNIYYTSDKSLVAGVNSAVANQSLAIPFYSPGNSNNNMYCVLVKPGYEYLKINITASGANITLPIQQRIDRSYNNP